MLWGSAAGRVSPQACARLEGEAAAAAGREAERRDAEGRLQEEATMLRRTLGAARRSPPVLTAVPALCAPPEGLLTCGRCS